MEALAPVIVGIINDANDACKQRLLRYARNEVIDALGERMQVDRLEATAAKCVLRFSLAAARDERYLGMHLQARHAVDDAHACRLHHCRGIIVAEISSIERLVELSHLIPSRLIIFSAASIS